MINGHHQAQNRFSIGLAARSCGKPEHQVHDHEQVQLTRPNSSVFQSAGARIQLRSWFPAPDVKTGL